MRLGVAGLVPRELDFVDDRIAGMVAELGFTGVVTHFLGDAETLPAKSLHRVRSILAEHGIRIVQSWGWQQPLVHPDGSVRQAAVRTLRHAVRVAADLGAGMVLTGPGSLNPSGPWWPHPGNHTPEAEDALVRSLREAMPACEAYGVPIALECHVTSVLDTPARVQRVVERVGSGWVKVNLDPVNFIPDLFTAFHHQALVNELFDRLGPHVAAAHVKDFYVEDRHVVHISETVPGDGLFDFDLFLQRYEALSPEHYAIVEHLPESLIPQAARHVRSRLRALSIRVLE
jgi:sugar phosphate isomerase/epimerase